MTGDPTQVRLLPHDFYDFMFWADPPKTEPLINSPSIALTFLYVAISTAISGKIIHMARLKVVLIKKACVNTYGSSIFTFRVLLLIQIAMWCNLIVYGLLSLLIIVANTLWRYAIMVPIKKGIIVLMGIFYQGRSLSSYLVVLNVIFEMISLIFLIKMEQTKSMPEILY